MTIENTPDEAEAPAPATTEDIDDDFDPGGKPVESDDPDQDTDTPERDDDASVEEDATDSEEEAGS